MGKPWNAKKVFVFVFKEMVRLQKELNSGAHRQWSSREALSVLPDPRGGIRHIGIAAETKLYELAERTIASTPNLVGRLQPNDLTQLFKRELGKAIYAESPKDAHQIVAECIEEARSKITADCTYFIPCLLPEHSLVQRFKVGPIVFHKKERLFASGISFDGREAELFDQLKVQKKVFNWVAAVRTSGFSPNIAEDRAYLFTRMAIAGIKMAFDDRSGKWLGTDQQLLPSYRDFRIIQRKDGKPRIGRHHQFFINGSDEQVAHLFASSTVNWMFALGSFIDHYIAVGDFGFLGNRIITALTWFDTGCSPISDAEKVIAYTNCMEALFVTEDHGQKEQLRRRATPFLATLDPETDWSDQIAAFYRIRSELVHGVISPLSPKVASQVGFGFEVSSASIQAVLCFCIWLLGRYPVDTTPRHLSPFNGRGSFSKVFAAHAAEFISEITSANMEQPPQA